MTEGSTPPAPPPGKGAARCFALGCLFMVLACVLFIGAAAVREAMKSPEQKAAEAKARAEHMAGLKEKDRKAAQELSRRFAAIARQLPAPTALAELPCPALAGKLVTFVPADPAFFGQFDDAGYVAAKAAPHVWYRSSKLDEAKELLAKVAANEEYYYSKVESVADDLAKEPYAAVFFPVEVRLPKAGADGKTFEPGLFDGWVVLVEQATGKPIRITRFTARSSDEVSRRTVKVVGIKIGRDMQKAIDEDFHKQFRTTAAEAIAR